MRNRKQQKLHLKVLALENAFRPARRRNTQRFRWFCPLVGHTANTRVNAWWKVERLAVGGDRDVLAAEDNLGAMNINPEVDVPQEKYLR